MKISDIRATTVTVPLEAPLRHANGVHWGRFVRTVVEVETDTGLVGLGEMGGGGESAEAVFRAMKSYLVGRDPARLEEMRFVIANPTASLYNNRTQVLAALEFACLDILGQAWGVPVSEILGGRVRDRVTFASYCFFRYPNPKSGSGEVRTIEQLVRHAGDLKKKYGFATHKVKVESFILTMNSRRIVRWPQRSHRILSASIRTACGLPNRRFASVRRLKVFAMTTWRIRSSG